MCVMCADWRQYSPKSSGVTPRRPKRARKLPKTADRVLDAPNLLNDFCECICIY